jgi:hypothetical protein
MSMEPRFWRGLRNAIVPSLLLWGLIIWSISSALAQGGASVRTTNVYPWGAIPIIGVGTGTASAVDVNSWGFQQ